MFGLNFTNIIVIGLVIAGAFGYMVYTQKDVEVYLKKINAAKKEMYYAPLMPQKIIYKMLEELSLCFRYKKEDLKADEIQQLMKILSNEES